MKEDADEIAAMCAEIASLLGGRPRQPGEVTIGEYARNTGLSEAGATKQLNRLVLQGRLVRDTALIDNHLRAVYRKPP